MYKQLVVNFALSNMMLFGEILFVSIFAASLIWVNRRGSKEFYDRLANMPMDDAGEVK